MEIKIGDKVRFLDAVGGGVVKSFKGKDMIMVLEDDGFETPALIRKCVVINEQNDAAAKNTTKTFVPQGKTPEKKQPEKIEAQQTALNKMSAEVPRAFETREGEVLNVNLAFLPAEGHTFIEGIYECYLVNDSNYTLYFNYASCSNNTWKSRFSGEIEPNSKLFIEEFGKNEIPELEKISFQCLAFKRGGFYKFKNTYSIELRLDLVKFYKLHCFRENDFFEEDALIVELIRNDNPEKTLMVSPDDIKKAMLEKEPEKPRVSMPLNKKKSEIMEVDLHINTLLDTTAGMDNAAILQYQLEVFRKSMDENLKDKGRKIVFIHGKGDGILRSAILKELKTKYSKCKYQDASFKEYGFGATMITIY